MPFIVLILQLLSQGSPFSVRKLKQGTEAASGGSVFYKNYSTFYEYCRNCICNFEQRFRFIFELDLGIDTMTDGTPAGLQRDSGGTGAGLYRDSDGTSRGLWRDSDRTLAGLYRDSGGTSTGLYRDSDGTSTGLWRFPDGTSVGLWRDFGGTQGSFDYILYTYRLTVTTCSPQFLFILAA